VVALRSESPASTSTKRKGDIVVVTVRLVDAAALRLCQRGEGGGSGRRAGQGYSWL
jgi:hypothetical protein